MTSQPHDSRARIETEELDSEVVCVRIKGEVGMASVASLRNVLDKLFDAGRRRVVIDLSDLSYIASSGIGCLVAAAERARSNRGDLFLACVDPKVQHVFDLMRLEKLVRYATSTSEAVEQLKQL